MKSVETGCVSDVAALVKEQLQDEQDLRVAILYGSAAAGKMHAASDVDVAVLFDCPLTAGRKMGLIFRLEKVLGRTVDLVDLHGLGGTLLRQILRNGVLLIQNRPGALGELIRRMVYNQTDVMPTVSRILIERQRRFIHG